MGKAKKKETPRRAIKRIIRENVWWSRDDKLHGVAVAADLIDREVVELSYQEGWKDRAVEAPGVVVGTVKTRHPEHYLLVNLDDGTKWGLSKEGRWVAAEVLVDGEKQ